MGGGPDPEDFNKPTPQEAALAETSAKMFNEYLKGKAIEKAYLADVSGDPALVADEAQGVAATDLAEKAPVAFRANPNAGMSAAPALKMATLRSKVGTDIGQQAVAQEAAAKQSYLDNALGQQTTADTAQAGLARDAVSRNITDATAAYDSNAASMRSLSSIAGAGAGLALAKVKKPTTPVNTVGMGVPNG